MSADNQTPDAEFEDPGAGIEITDIYYMLFRRKWLIFGGILFGVLAAAGLWKLRQPLYESDAKLLVKYVVETPAMVVPGTEVRVQNPDEGGAGVLNSEIEILNSVDLVQHVVRVVGPGRILPEGADTNDVDRAAGIVSKHFKAVPLQRSKILSLRFSHAKSDVAQKVLEELIDSYLRKHDEIHRSLGISDQALVQQRDQLRTNLANAELEYRRMREKVGIHSLDDSKAGSVKQQASTRQELFAAQAEYAQKKTLLDALRQQAGTGQQTPAGYDPNAVPPSDKIDEYRIVSDEIAALSRKLQELSGLTERSPLVATNQLRLQDARARKSMLESNFPTLQRFTSTMPAIAFAPAMSSVPGMDVATLAGQVAAIESKITILSNQLEAVRLELNGIEGAEAELTEQQRRIASMQKQLAFLEQSLMQSKFNAGLGDRQNTSISKVQSPSPPDRNFAQLYKKMAMALAGGLFLGIILAVIAEKLLDRSLKRTKEVEATLPVPLFLTIPSMRIRRRLKASKPARGDDFAVAKSKSGSNAGVEVMDIPGDGPEELKPYHDALRDRLVNYFDMRDMTHKPKLIAVTSCGEGAGVSSTATGLAASLSETGDGNVLVVDMRGKKGAAHAFYQGKPAIGLAEALESNTRDSALVQENLYVVAAGSPDQKLQRILPQQFSRFVPKLKASDYDYIIFDMPPVAQTSVTAKVARYMDMVLMVLESEKTDREVARRAGQLLAESNATVATVFNKHRSYVPKWLLQEFH